MRGTALTALVILMTLGCIESNPQPAPGKGANEVQGPSLADVSESAADAVGETVPAEVGESDLSLPPDVIVDDGVQSTGGCCAADDECTGGKVCIGAGGMKLGTCQPKPGNVCYSDETCPEFYFCDGGHVCTCDMDCGTVPGQCAPGSQGCCETDEDCPEGTRCVIHEGNDEGACLVKSDQPYRCWDAEDCPEGQVCFNAYWCGCAFFGCGPFSMGYCQDQ